jgi:hypothetical protein
MTNDKVSTEQNHLKTVTPSTSSGQALNEAVEFGREMLYP